MEAKEKEHRNLQDYEIFVEVNDEGQEKIGSRWVVKVKKSMTDKRHSSKQDW